MARCPKTAAEAFKRLDRKLTKEEKKEIVEAKDMIDFHFSLGMWIRNYWIYSGEKENLAALLKDLGVKVLGFEQEESEEMLDPIILMHPDSMSSDILEAYQKYLKEKG